MSQDMVLFSNVAILLDIASCSPYVNRRFEGMYQICFQDRKSVEQETSVEQVARPTRFCIPVDGNINIYNLLL
jgi:hypothetical protein